METKTQQNARLFLKLLAPSRTGGLLTVVFAFFIVLAVMTPKFYEIANLDLYLGYIKEHPNGFYKQSLEASNAVNSSRFAADSSVFIVWGVAGLIGYSGRRLNRLFTYYRGSSTDKKHTRFYRRS